MKEKMLMKLERDRIRAKVEAIEAQMKAMQVGLYRSKVGEPNRTLTRRFNHVPTDDHVAHVLQLLTSMAASW